MQPGQRDKTIKNYLLRRTPARRVPVPECRRHLRTCRLAEHPRHACAIQRPAQAARSKRPGAIAASGSVSCEAMRRARSECRRTRKTKSGRRMDPASAPSPPARPASRSHRQMSSCPLLASCSSRRCQRRPSRPPPEPSRDHHASRPILLMEQVADRHGFLGCDSISVQPPTRRRRAGREGGRGWRDRTSDGVDGLCTQAGGAG